MCFTLYNLKTLFLPPPPHYPHQTYTQFTNGFHISSTGSFSPVLASVIDYATVREIAFPSGEGLDAIEMLWANPRNERFRPSSLWRSQWVLSAKGLVRLGQYKLRHLPVVDAGRLFPAEVTKCSLSEQEAWKPDNALSGSHIPFCKFHGLVQEHFNEQLLSAWSPMCTLCQLQDWSSLKSSLFTQFLACALEGWSLPLLCDAGIISTEAWRPRRAPAGRVWGHCRRTFSGHALRWRSR